MTCLEIKDSQNLYAIVVRSGEIRDGLNFYTPDSAFIQLGTWKYQKGKILSPHAHRVCERVSTITQEFVFVKRGAVRMDIYDAADKLFQSVTLNQGDFALIYQGGHGYEILEDGTEVVEVKNGPYPGLEKDKRTLS